MGMFDTVHTGDVCIQVKCLGRLLSDFVPGDRVTLYRPVTDDEYLDTVRELGRVCAFHHSESGIAADLGSYCVLLDAGVLVVDESVIVGWEPWARPDLPLVGNDGMPVADPTAPGVRTGFGRDAHRPIEPVGLVPLSFEEDHGEEDGEEDALDAAAWLRRLVTPEGPCARCAEVRARRRPVEW